MPRGWRNTSKQRAAVRKNIVKAQVRRVGIRGTGMRRSLKINLRRHFGGLG